MEKCTLSLKAKWRICTEGKTNFDTFCDIHTWNKNLKNEKLFNECGHSGKKQLGDLILKNLHFSEYFAENDIYSNIEVFDLFKEAKKEKMNDVLEYAFKSQKGNSLLIITFFAQKKIEEKGFMEELEKNYGIYFDVDKFIKEMNQKLNEIKSFQEMFKYVGSEFGSDKDDYQLIIEGYERARKKGYIRSNGRRRRSN